MSAALEIGHVELRVRDLDAAVQFYRDVFAWTISPVSPSYAVVDAGAAPTIGIRLAGRMPVGIGHHCIVDDLDAMSRRVGELGGEIVMRGEADGPFAVALDRWDNELFFSQSAHPQPRGPRANPVAFLEFSVVDVVAAQTYYRELCGWSFWSPVTTVGGFAIAEGHGLALGIGVCLSKVKGTTTYFEVDDLGAMLHRLGGRGLRVSPANAFPDGGRYALLLDPDDIRVGLYEPARS